MKKSAILLLSLCLAAWAAEEGATTANQVLTDIHHANQMEIHMAQLAMKKSKDKSVKDYAKRLLKDHRAADGKVMDLAKSEGLTLAKTEKTAEEADAMMGLKKKSGAEFDREYMNLMESDHTKVIEKLKSAQDTVPDQKVKDLIGELLPTLGQHHDQASQLAQRLNSEQKSS